MLQNPVVRLVVAATAAAFADAVVGEYHLGDRAELPQFAVQPIEHATKPMEIQHCKGI
jgi:hypothetical protein